MRKDARTYSKVCGITNVRDGEGARLVSESAIKTRKDIEALSLPGIDAVLIGTSLMRADNIEGKVRELFGNSLV